MFIEGQDHEALIFAAVEAFYDPHKIITEAHAISFDIGEKKFDTRDKSFLLEHIISGAMAASVAERSKRFAFARDKKTGIAKGVTLHDVLDAVNAIFEENRNLDHSFAQGEFLKEFAKEVEDETKKKMN